MIELEELLEHFEGVRRNGTGHTARCPAHDDRNASLSIGEGDEGYTFHCFAGCEADDVIKAAGLKWPDLFYDDEPEPRVVETYYYDNALGHSYYRVLRFEPKDFRPQQYDGNQWHWGLPALRVPYRMLELLASNGPVFVVDGEKDVDAIYKAGGIATCAVGGMGGWILRGEARPEMVMHLEDRHVIIVADKDGGKGREQAKKLKTLLEPVAASVRVVEAKAGKDAFDHLEAGHKGNEFVPVDLDWRWPALDLDVPVPPAQWLLEGMIAKGDVTVLYGPPGGGKTFFSYGLGLSVGQGFDVFAGCDVRSHGKVLYVDKEMPKDLVYQRMKAMGLSDWRSWLRYLWMPDIWLDQNPDEFIEEAVKFGPELIVLDSLTRLHTAEENAVEGIGPVFTKGLKPLANETGAAVVVLHHVNAAGARPRGSTDIEAAPDAVLRLEVDEEFPSRFTIRHTKSRRTAGRKKLSLEIVDGMDGRVHINVPLGGYG